ncbi:hypothetical protein JRO89_XS06G0088000 [Xanthoceras sorbifolium]|uniref:3'(2'),5'-bisphosphate nucleotidase n=1 Tax=Xanthoceras sorbifolium TaxID=99658 RepID=A0ABQ8HXB9_9ROSI|nr:hypothetical protein JRO89_XS06G0088000 [Xanthoceras sorbifolium]
MDVLHNTSRFFCPHPSSPTLLRRRFSTVRSSLPFPNEKAKYHRELEAAVDVVERACRLCVDVKKSLFSSEGRILEKNDQTPVTVADFGVQALVSLGIYLFIYFLLLNIITMNQIFAHVCFVLLVSELSKFFPLIPLVAEEDSAFLRSNNLVDSVFSAVTDKASSGDESLTHDDILEAIDRGGKDSFVFGMKPATYWVLDPIDGTKGFLKGTEALYVVGLALVVEGEIVLGVMGCPNWQEDKPLNSTSEVQGNKNIVAGSGIIMVAHAGCGTWTKRLSSVLGTSAKTPESWTSPYIDSLSHAYATGTPRKAGFYGTKCLCKYLTVALGRASTFILRARAQTTIKAWDHAVGMICVHEAGGKVTDWEGGQLDLGADQVGRRIIFPSGGVLVTNGSVHDKILEMISSTSSIV